MNAEQLKIALIGCGAHTAENLAPAIQNSSLAEVVAICDVDETLIKRIALRFPRAKQYCDYRQLIKDRVAEALVVAAPPQVHVEIAREALNREIPIFLEKPPAQTTAELFELATIAESRRIVTMVGHNLRYATAVAEMRRLIDDGQFGRINTIDVRYLASKPRGTRWGMSSLRGFLLSHACHAIDLMVEFAGSVQAVSVTAFEGSAGEVTLDAQLTFSGGALGSLLATTGAPHFMLDVMILSDNQAMIRMENLCRVRALGMPQDERRWGPFWEPRTLEVGYQLAGYEGELTCFFNAVRDAANGVRAKPSFHDEIAIYQVMDLIEQSLAQPIRRV